jgi:hypothetical protein
MRFWTRSCPGWSFMLAGRPSCLEAKRESGNMASEQTQISFLGHYILWWTGNSEHKM